MAVKRIAEKLPDVKIIVLLRNPTDRAISHYKMQKKRGIEERDIEQAINEEKKIIKYEKNKVYDNQYSFYHQKLSYLDRGKYIEQLKVWYKYFDEEQIFVVESEEFFHNTEEVLYDIYDFLNVSRYNNANLKVHNKGKSNYTIPENIKEEINEYFEPYNQELYEYLDKDFGW